MMPILTACLLAATAPDAASAATATAAPATTAAKPASAPAEGTIYTRRPLDAKRRALPKRGGRGGGQN